jgi:tRNA dimethylallyltransferase
MSPPADADARAAAGPVIVVAGPTASGKSALAVDLAERVSGVVINADSMQVYRGLDVLTSAPDAKMRARVPHRLFGITGPGEPCSAGEWRDLAMAEIRAAHEAGQVPVVVGGTGLYLRTLMAGIARLPAIPGAIRERVRASLASEGSAALHERLAQRDPVTAGRLSPHDSQRICRALEVLDATGKSLTDWQREGTRPADLGGLEFFTILLMPPREILYPACDARFGRMLEEGALDEIRRLAQLALDPDLPAMKALGVPHLLEHLKGGIGLDEARRLGQQATRHYVKRQMTWFSRQIVAEYVINSQYNECWLDKIFPKISEFVLTCRA